MHSVKAYRASDSREKRVYSYGMAIAVPLRRSSRSDEGARTAALYRAHGAELLRFAWHRLGRLEDAEDAVQATFLSAHRVLVEGEQIREPRAWLFRILRNECLTRIATTKRRGVPEHLEDWHADAAPGVAEQVEQREEFDTTVALLASLPGPQRDALVLREWLGLSSIETATIIDSTPQGVDALIYRARKSLVAVPDADDQSTCADTRRALAADEITVRTRAHLVGCRSCRAAALRLRAPEEVAVANGILPLDSLAEGLGVLVPGFAAALGITILGGATATAATTAATAAGTTAGTAGAVTATAGGAATVAATTTATVATATVGTATATTAVASGAVLGAKVAVGIALGVGVVGGTVATVPAVREAVTPIVQIEGERPQAKPPRIENGDGKRVAVAEPPPAAALAGSAVEPPRTPKGVEAGATSKDATSGAPPAEAGAVEAASPAAAAAVVAEPTAPVVAEESNAGAAAAANVVAAAAVAAAPEVEKAAAKAALVAEEKAKREAERAAEKARLEAERVEKAAAKAVLVAEEKAKREAERAAEKVKREAERAATAAAKASKSEGSGGSAAAVMGASS